MACMTTTVSHRANHEDMTARLLTSLQLGSATFDSRADFKAGQGAQPAIPFQILNLYNNCNSVSPTDV